MATFNFKIVKAKEGASVVIGDLSNGSLALGTIVDGDNTILLTIPYSALAQLGTCIIPTADLLSEDKVAEYDVSGSLDVS